MPYEEVSKVREGEKRRRRRRKKEKKWFFIFRSSFLTRPARSVDSPILFAEGMQCQQLVVITTTNRLPGVKIPCVETPLFGFSVPLPDPKLQ